MPISEDEFEFKPLQDPQSTMSKAELRKTHKPIMEKRRRARINHCLNEIKSLILEAMNKDPARHSKLEKADILEMAVKHLQNVQRQQLAMSMATDPSVLRKFKNGFNECATEIDNYIDQIDGLDTSMKQRVSAHLQKCIGGIEQVAQFNFPGFNNLSFLSGSNVFNSNQNNVLEPSANAGDQNNNPRIQIPQGLQLIPSRLPSGELALLVPNSNSLPYFSSMANQNASQNIQPKRPSAFATVIPSTSLEISKPLSPPMSPENPTDDLSVRPFEIIRNPSPKGFRPVITKPRPSYVNEDHQVAQVSSTSIPEKHQFIQPMEVKSIKFPIHKYGVEKEQRKLDSPKKIGEPLCIITNQSERYKLAQVKEDSAQFEENLVPRGVKRKFNEFSQQGLLTVASQEYQPSKVFKPYHEVKPNPSGSNLSRSLDFSKPFSQNDGQQPSGSKDDGNNDMWRPW